MRLPPWCVGGVLIGAFVLVTGCSSVKLVDREQPAEWLPGAKRGLVKEEATITMNDGSTARGTIVRLSADSLTLRLDDDAGVRSEPLSRVAVIRPDRRAGGVVAGVLLGTLLGAVAGAAVAAENEEPQPEVLGFNQGFAAVGGAALGAVVGAVAGGMIVGLATSVADYKLYTASATVAAPRRVPAVPDTIRTLQ
jgi:hypothetical protein